MVLVKACRFLMDAFYISEYCPKAYNPLTVHDDTPRRSVILTVGLADDVPGKVGGNLIFEFNKDTVAFSPLSSGEQCKEFIEKLPGVKSVNCIKETHSLPYVFNIEFTEFSVSTIENNIYTHNGNPSLADFYCENSNMMGTNTENEIPQDAEVYCTLSDLNVDGLPEYAECSQHGECNSRSGACSCDRGFYGLACDDTTDATDHHVFEHDGPFFTGTVLKSVGIRSPSAEFNVFQAGISSSSTADIKPYTTVRGDGTLVHSGGDVVVTDGSLSVQGLDPESESLLKIAVSRHASSSATTWKKTNATLIEGSTFMPGQFHVQLFHTETPINPETGGFYEPTGTFSVLNITAHGDLSTSGNLCASNRTFVVEDGMVVAESLNVVNSLDVHGSANIEDSLTIGSGFALTPEGMTIDSNTHSGPLLELRSMQKNFDGSLLEINTVPGSASSLIRATVDDGVTFDLSTSGDMTLKGLRMLSGGIDVDSGGIRVKSGGLMVDGGFTLNSGDFVLPHNDLHSQSVHVENSNMAQALLSLKSTSGDYTGTAISVDVKSDKSKSFNILEAKSTNGHPIVRVDGAGSLMTAGDTEIGGDLIVRGFSQIKGGISFDKVGVGAGDKINIPTRNAVYIEITDDGRDSRNEITFEKGNFDGQVTVVTNLDHGVTTGDAVIHSGSTQMFIFNNGNWKTLEAVTSHFEEITGVRKLQVENDIFIGNHTISAGGLKLLDVGRGDIIVGGLNGQLRTRGGFTFTNNILTTPFLNAKELAGPLNAGFHVISDAVLDNSNLKGASILAKDIRLAHLNGIAYFDNDGSLKSTEELKISEDGKLLLSDLYNDIDLHSGSLKNVGDLAVGELNAENGNFDRLSFPTLSTSKSGDFAVLGDDNSLNFTSVVSIDENGLLNVEKLGAYEQVGTVNFQSNKLLEPVIIGGSIEKAVEINSMRYRLLNADGVSQFQTNRLAVLTPDGVLQRDNENEINTVGKLEVTSLTVADVHMTGLAAASTDSGVELLASTEDTGNVVKSGVTLKGDTLIVPRIESSFVDAQKLSLRALGGGVLVSELSGEVKSVNDVDVSSLVSKSIEVSGHAQVSTLAVDSLSSDASVKTRSIVTVDNSGVLGTDSTVEADSFIATSSLSTPVLRIPGAEVKGVLAVIDDAGTIQGKSSIEVEMLKVTSTTDIVGELSAASIRVKELGSSCGGSCVVSCDESGELTAKSSVALKRVSAENVAADSLSALSLHLPHIPPGSLLQVSAGHEVQQASEINVNSMMVNTLAVEGNDLVLTAVTGASVLSTDMSGKVIPATTVDVESLSVATSATVGSLITASLGVTSLSEGVMIVGGSGNISSTVDLQLSTIATGAIEVMGEANVGNIRLRNEEPGILLVDKDGVVQSSSDLEVESISAHKDVNAKNLNTDSIKFTNGLQNTLLAVDMDGVISAATPSHLAHLAAETITSEQGSFSKLHFANSGGKQITNDKSHLMTVDSSGVVNADDTIEILHVSSDTLAVEMADVKTLLLPHLSEGSILAVHSGGKVVPAQDVNVRSVTATDIDGSTVVADVIKFKSWDRPEENLLASISPNGSIQPTSKVSASSLTSESLDVIGTSTLNHLSANSIKLKNVEVSSEIASQVLSIDSTTGNIVASPEVALRSIQVDSATVSGSVTASEFFLSDNAESGVVSVADDGSLKVVPDVTLSSLTSSSISTQSLTLEAMEFPGGILSVDESGSVRSTRSASLTNVDVSNSLNVIGTFSSANIKVSSLANDKPTSTTLLSADREGFIRPVTHVSTDKISTSSLISSSKAFLESLRLGSIISAPVLVTDSMGDVVGASSIDGLVRVGAEDVSANTLTAETALVMPTITSAAVLSTDSKGNVVGKRELKLSSIDVTSLAASKISSEMIQLKGMGPGVLSADVDGNVIVSKDITTDGLNAATISSSQSIQTTALKITQLKSASLLTTDDEGIVSASDKLSIPKISTASIDVAGLGVLESLKVTDLATAKSSLLTTNENGKIIASSEAKVSSLHAGDISVSGSLSTSSLSIPGAATGGILTVANSGGGVDSTSDIKVNDIKTNALEVSGDAVVGDLRVKALSMKLTSPELVVVDSNGKLTSTSNLDAFLPDLKDSSFNSVDVSGSLKAKSFHVSSGNLVDGMVMSVDENGVMKPTANPALNGLTVSSDLKVQGSVQASKLVLADTSSSILYSNARNEVEALANSEVLKDGTLSLGTARIGSLVGDISLNGHSLTEAKIEKTIIRDSDIFLQATTSKHGGRIALRNMVCICCFVST